MRRSYDVVLYLKYTHPLCKISCPIMTITIQIPFGEPSAWNPKKDTEQVIPVWKSHVQCLCELGAEDA
jgi:hypothetical protein